MPHVRLRKFNTRSMWKGQDISNDLAMVVRAGSFVFLRGQTGMDLNGKIHGINDPGKQAEIAMRSMKTLLEEAGSRMADVCKIVIYVTDRAYREPVYRVVGKWLRGVHPVSTGLIVEGLARPELLMEIDAYAVIPEERMKRLVSVKKTVAKKSVKKKRAVSRARKV
jgi:enamine deaminase RidA (YjgF/YER057c/UK114 family)